MLSKMGERSQVDLVITDVNLSETVHAVADSFQQLDLLEAPVVSRQQEKQEKLERTMDAIRGKYGRGSISFGLPGEERAGWDD